MNGKWEVRAYNYTNSHLSHAVVILCFLCLCAVSNVTIASEEGEKDMTLSRFDNVQISTNCIVMPIGRILLIRKGDEYCAMKFIRFWNGKTEWDRYAEYESYFPIDNKVGFVRENIRVSKDVASFSKLYGVGRLAISFGTKEIKCGAFRLAWDGRGIVCFFGKNQKQGDYGIELAPTPWTDTAQINLSDERTRWYRYDTARKKITLPIDNVWTGL